MIYESECSAHLAAGFFIRGQLFVQHIIFFPVFHMVDVHCWEELYLIVLARFYWNSVRIMPGVNLNSICFGPP